jgi:hypothetical protein
VPAFLTLAREVGCAGGDGRPLAWASSRRREERGTDLDDCSELELRVWPAPARLIALLDCHGKGLDGLDA